jgi:ubiquinone/menaquinone biosynthesis C-methylase UbiE
VDFQVGDAQSLPFADGQFDAGAMALVITFVPDPNKAVAELKRVTKPAACSAPTCGIFSTRDFRSICSVKRSKGWAWRCRSNPDTSIPE